MILDLLSHHWRAGTDPRRISAILCSVTGRGWSERDIRVLAARHGLTLPMMIPMGPPRAPRTAPEAPVVGRERKRFPVPPGGFRTAATRVALLLALILGGPALADGLVCPEVPFPVPGVAYAGTVGFSSAPRWEVQRRVGVSSESLPDDWEPFAVDRYGTLWLRRRVR